MSKWFKRIIYAGQMFALGAALYDQFPKVKEEIKKELENLEPVVKQELEEAYYRNFTLIQFKEQLEILLKLGKEFN